VTKRDLGSGAIAAAGSGARGVDTRTEFAQSIKRSRIKTDREGRQVWSVGPEGQKGGKAGARARRSPPVRRPGYRMARSICKECGLRRNFANTGGPFDLQPWAAALMKERRDNLSKDDPEGFCLRLVSRESRRSPENGADAHPAGHPRRGKCPQLSSNFSGCRGHSKQDQLWMGDSIGKWDGDTLWSTPSASTTKLGLPGRACRIPTSCTWSSVIAVRTWGTFRSTSLWRIPGPLPSRIVSRGIQSYGDTDLLEYVCNEFNVDKDHLYGK